MEMDPVARIAKNWWLFLVLGLVSVVAGVLILALPGISLVTLAILFAISLIVRGVFAIITAFRLRGLEHEPGAAAPA